MSTQTIAALQTERMRLAAELMKVESLILASSVPITRHSATLDSVLNAVSEAFKLPRECITSRRRPDYIAIARHAYYYVSAQVSGCSHNAIAKHIGRVHGSATNGERKCRNLIETSPSYAKTVREIEGRVR